MIQILYHRRSGKENEVFDVYMIAFCVVMKILIIFFKVSSTKYPVSIEKNKIQLVIMPFTSYQYDTERRGRFGQIKNQIQFLLIFGFRLFKLLAATRSAPWSSRFWYDENKMSFTVQYLSDV